METEILGVILQIVLLIGLSIPLGKYIAKVYKGNKSCLDFFKTSRKVDIQTQRHVNPEEEMDWKQFLLRTLLVVNLFWFVWGMVLLVIQGILPLNPDGNLGQTAHQAFNTCISFMVNCNLQRLQRRERSYLFHTTLRHHALSIPHRKELVWRQWQEL